MPQQVIGAGNSAQDRSSGNSISQQTVNNFSNLVPRFGAPDNRAHLFTLAALTSQPAAT